jgi:hypothetical protein
MVLPNQLKGGIMEITKQQLIHFASLHLPCSCGAPIVYHATINEDDHSSSGITIFKLHLNSPLVEILYTDIEEDMDQDDIGLRCTRCGANWTSANPLFF